MKAEMELASKLPGHLLGPTHLQGRDSCLPLPGRELATGHAEFGEGLSQ